MRVLGKYFPYEKKNTLENLCLLTFSFLGGRCTTWRCGSPHMTMKKKSHMLKTELKAKGGRGLDLLE